RRPRCAHALRAARRDLGLVRGSGPTRSPARRAGGRSCVVHVLTLVVCVVGPLLVATLATGARRAATAGRLRGLAVRDRWRLPRASRERLARALDDADVALTPEAAVELWGVGILTLAVAAAALAPGLVVPAVVAGAAGGAVGPRLA